MPAMSPASINAPFVLPSLATGGHPGNVGEKQRYPRNTIERGPGSVGPAFRLRDGLPRGVDKAMTILLIGLALIAAVLGLFYVKDARASHRLARLAYSEPVMRLTVVAAALVFFGLLMAIGELLN